MNGAGVLDEVAAGRLCRSTLGHLGRPYPHMQVRWLEGPADLATPESLDPIFHGSFDWHSCVHGAWQVMRIARLYPALPEAAQARAWADAMLVPAKVAVEMLQFERPGGASFERPYGWAWALALHLELSEAADGRWAAAVEPLARMLAARLADYLQRLDCPVRYGFHGNTAFAMTLALAWARRHDAALVALIAARARHWFGEDRPAPWIEPGGEDFLSPALCVAALMARILPVEEAGDWLARQWAEPAMAALERPVLPGDRTDPRMAHLDGLNLSCAWCWRRLAAIPSLAGRASVAAEAQLSASLPHLADHYMGEHWLASFAVLAMTDAFW